MSGNGWYTVTEAAKTLDVSPETIRRRLRLGELEGEKDGNMWRVRVDDISNDYRDVADNTTQNVVRLESKVELLQEKNQMFQEQIGSLKERIRELETDKGFLLNQIEEKDKVISKLMPRALPEPKVGIGERFKRLFRRGEE